MVNKKPNWLQAKLLNWLGVPIELTSAGFWSTWATQGNTAGQAVNEKTVLGLSAAWACTRLISESAGTLPLHVFEKTATGRKSAGNHHLQYILNNSPNASSISSQFWSAVVASMLLRGNALAEIKRSSGRVVALNFLHPDNIRPVMKNGLIKKIIVYDQGRPVKTLARRDVLHIPYFSVDGEWGLSTIAYGGAVFGGALAAATSANNTFKNGLNSGHVFTTDRIVLPEQRDEFRENLQKISGAVNAGKAPLLEAGMDIKPISIAPKDAQLLESRAFTVEEICRWFGIDPSLVGHGKAVSNWGTGLEQKMIGFLTFTLRPILRRIEQSVNKYLIPDIEQDRYYTEFAIEGLLRADSAGRASFYSTMVNAGIFTRDEIRSLENRPEFGGNAAKLTIQQGFTTLDNIGNEHVN